MVKRIVEISPMTPILGSIVPAIRRTRPNRNKLLLKVGTPSKASFFKTVLKFTIKIVVFVLVFPPQNA